MTPPPEQNPIINCLSHSICIHKLVHVFMRLQLLTGSGIAHRALETGPTARIIFRASCVVCGGPSFQTLTLKKKSNTVSPKSRQKSMDDAFVSKLGQFRETTWLRLSQNSDFIETVLGLAVVQQQSWYFQINSK